MTVTTLRKLAFALSVTTDFIVNGNPSVSPCQCELDALFQTLSTEKQVYALQILRTFAEAVHANESEN